VWSQGAPHFCTGRKYGDFWPFEVQNGHFDHGPGKAVVLAVAPGTVFGFGKGEPFSQTRWRFT
jgi:hypothetical protein